MSDNNITYHKAGLNDVQTLIDNRILFALELTGPKTEEAIHELKGQFKQYFTKAISDNSCISYIARSGSEIAGIGSMTLREQPGSFKNPTGRFAYIMNMYTRPVFRRKGICTSILNLLVDEATKAGITAFELHATKEGEFVYKQHGFEEHIEPTYRKYTN